MKKRILMLLLALTVLVGAFTLTASAAESEVLASGTCGENLTWKLTTDGNLHISGTGKMADYLLDAPWYYTYLEAITAVTIDDGVTSIGDYAFYGCYNLKRIDIPESVTSLGACSFVECANLTSITIPECSTSISDCAFSGCASLTNVTIPDSVTHIGPFAFDHCTCLDSITIPASVISIGENAFYNCASLNHVYYGGTDEQWNEIEISDGNYSLTFTKNKVPINGTCGDNITWTLATDGSLHISGTGEMTASTWNAHQDLIRSVTIDEGITTICDHAFFPCTNLTSATIPASVTYIGNYAFSNCQQLSSVTIPNNVTYIGNNAFAHCKQLTSVTIPSSVITMGDKAFYGCTSLTSAIFSEGITFTGNDTFARCDNLVSVTIPEGVTAIGNGAFYLCANLSGVTIPSTCNSIGDLAFYECTSLTNVTIPESVTSLGDHAFADCSGLDSVTIHKGVTSIGVCPFDCKIYVDEDNPNYSSDSTGSLFNKQKTVLLRVPVTSPNDYAIPASVTSIGDYAFRDCEGLTNYSIPHGIISIGVRAFDGCTNMTSISIPTSVTSIEAEAFFWCPKLIAVYYDGTKEQWNAIHIGTNNNSLLRAVIHFKSENPPSNNNQSGAPDISTSLSNSEFVQQVESAKEDAYIVADYSGEATLPETAFNAIAGTDKTLDLVSDGVTWRFSGNDIVNEVKPIDLKVEIMPVEEHPSDAAQEIQTALEDKPAVVMQFPENGTLPGKAIIQVKVDQAMQEYLGSNQGLWVYYFNNQTKELELIAKDLVVLDGTYVEFSITHCSNYVLTKSEHKFPFTDVRNGMWYLNPVFWAVNNKITAGVSETSFAPDATCTRAQIVTFLWRANGSPEPTSSSNPFWDVSSSDYFYKAVLWAVEKGITSGTSATSFSPDAGCTRGQVATFLWRAEGAPASGAENIFTDITPDAYYYDAVLWAVANSITVGMGDGIFAPDTTCTRGQIVTFLYRAMV